MLQDQVFGDLREDFGLKPDDLLLVAVSGGADSLALLHLLKSHGLNLLAAHFDHQLRPSAAEEAANVQALATEWGLPFKLGRADVAAYAEKQKIGIEEAARQCRYRFLFAEAEAAGARAVLTAHHADDQVETILMHFLRGAGFNGLEGMRKISWLSQYSTRIPIWRPLLNTPKAALLRYCQEASLDHVSDESNTDQRYFRNQLRHGLIPEIEKIAPNFRQIILRNAEAIQRDNALLDQVSSASSQEALPCWQIESLNLDREQFLEQLPAAQTRMLKAAILALEPDLRDIGFTKLEDLVEAVRSATPQTEIGKGLWLSGEGSKIRLRKDSEPDGQFPQLFGELELPYPVEPLVLDLSEGFSLHAEIISADDYQALSKTIQAHPDHAFLSLDGLSFPLRLASARPAQRWQPLGMAEGSQKLSDTFINFKIPRPERAAYPLLFNGDEIVWIPGVRIAHPYRLKEKEARLLHLALHRL